MVSCPSKRFVIPGSLLILAIACASYTDITRRMRSEFIQGNFQAALADLEQSDIKGDYNSRLLYHLERAMIFDHMDDTKSARKELFTSDQIAEELFTTSIINTAKTFVVSDRSSDYEGEIFEKVAIHTMLALSFLDDDDFQSAGVEARKINNVLYKITQDYSETYNSYREDGFARYLSALIHEANGKIDDAIIDYRKALATYDSSSYSPFFRGGIGDTLLAPLVRLAYQRGRKDVLSDLQEKYPTQVERILETVKAGQGRDEGEIIVIHQLGVIVAKAAKDFIIPWGNKIIRFSFPYYPQSSSYYFGDTGFDISGTVTKRVAAENLADLDAIAYRCLEDRRGRMILKNSARLILKSQIQDVADRNMGPLAGLLVNAFNVATETADTRSWTTLPARFSVSRARLKAGTYDVKIKTAGRVSDVESVTISRGKANIFRSY